MECHAIENYTHNQALLAERLLLLHKLDLDYSDHSASHDRLGRGMKLLDTIALLLSTGLPGDHFAAAFDKRQGLEVILAKNGTPTSEDIADAEELFSRLCNPQISTAGDLYPFVARRCRASVVKRIQKLRASIIDTGFYDTFYSRLDQYPSANEPISPSLIVCEFFEESDSMAKDYAGEPLSVVLRDLLEGTVGAQHLQILAFWRSGLEWMVLGVRRRRDFNDARRNCLATSTTSTPLSGVQSGWEG